MAGLDNSFYKDNSPNYDEFKLITSTFDGLSKVLDEIVFQSIDNSNISTMRAFKTIPIQTINVIDACYSLTTILLNQDMLKIVGINPTMPMSEKIDLWEKLEPKSKAQALDFLGLTLLLVNPNNMKSDNVYNETFSVVDFEIYDYNSGSKLIYGIDYYYEQNKIFFLKFGSQVSKYNNKKVVLKNITIDTSIAQKTVGESIGIYPDNNFSPSEYRDVVTLFTSTAMGGPTIMNLNKSFNSDTSTYSSLGNKNESIDGVKVIDFKSADKIKKEFWEKEIGNNEKLSIFDFIVSIPSDYLSKPEKMNYIQQFIKIIKPVHTNFIITPEFNIKDSLSLKYANSLFVSHGSKDLGTDKMRYLDSNKYLSFLSLLDRTRVSTLTDVFGDGHLVSDGDDYVDSIVMNDSVVSISFLKDLFDTLILRELDRKIRMSGSKTLSTDKMNKKDTKSQLVYADLVDRGKVVLSNGIKDDGYWLSDERDYVDGMFVDDRKVDLTLIRPLGDTMTSEDSTSLSNSLSKKDNVKNSDDIQRLLRLPLVEAKISSRDFASEYVTNTISDSITRNTDIIAILNAKTLCDKINGVEDTIFNIACRQHEKVTFSSKPNILRCDSVFTADDSGDNIYAADSEDVRADSHEVILFKFIPKN